MRVGKKQAMNNSAICNVIVLADQYKQEIITKDVLGLCFTNITNIVRHFDEKYQIEFREFPSVQYVKKIIEE
jgi:hypothetical protein